MAVPSSSYSLSSGIGPMGPQVFMSFRGKDVRKDLVSLLLDAMRRKNINVYIDAEEVRGLNLQHILFKRIQESKIAVAILSDEYTDSEWCLDELVKIMECEKEGTLHVIPIFYKLDASDVKGLNGTFGEKFRQKKKNFQIDAARTQKWEEALASVPYRLGIPISELSAESINEVVQAVLKTLSHSTNSVENAGQRQAFMIYAKKLKIEWSELASCWTFMSVREEPNGEAIEVAKMNEVWFLHVSGFFHTKDLTPGTSYEVVFVVKVEDGLSGWDSPAKLQLNVPHGNEPQEQELSFDGYIKNTWVDIRAGVFVAPPQSKKITFSLSQHETDERKTGLQIKGVSIRPTQ